MYDIYDFNMKNSKKINKILRMNIAAMVVSRFIFGLIFIINLRAEVT